MPDELLGEIFYDAGLEETKKACRSRLLSNAAAAAMKRIFENRILTFDGSLFSETETIEYSVSNGDIFIIFGSIANLESLFRRFGEYARRIEIDYRSIEEISVWRDISQRFIMPIANQLTELRVLANDDGNIWKQMSNRKQKIHFPNVKKFSYFGSDSHTGSYDLNSIFPQLETFHFFGDVMQSYRLPNVSNLTELVLESSTIQEHQLEYIFANNEKIKKLTISIQKWQTLHSIAQHLKNLQTLKVQKAGNEFLTRKNNNVYNLTSVTFFDIAFDSTSVVIAELPFVMPNLKKLRLRSKDGIDHRIVDFIKYFPTLKSVEFRQSGVYDIIDCIEKLPHIKEVTTHHSEFDKTKLSKFFQNFDKKKSNLHTLNLKYSYDTEYPIYEKAMIEINRHLTESQKPTWSVTFEQKHKESLYILLSFKRNL